MKYKWIHLSDIHVGMNVQGWMWNTIKHAFFNDIKELHRQLGEWDFVIFSGDLVQSGKKEEYQKLNHVLSEIWSVFKELGFNPGIFCVPGNHDLVRPDELEPEFLALKNWWGNEKLQESFWKTSGERYRSAVNGYFKSYESWINNLTNDTGITLLRDTSGLLIGDSSAALKKGETSLGLVGLNSSWLHLHNDSKETLDISPEQIFATTKSDPTKWCSENNLNLLITHHPLDWLHPASQKKFLEAVAPSGRFTAHLFGHMHDSSCISLSKGGTAKKIQLQAASLFGLEKYKSGTSRIHGYSLNQLEFTSPNTALLSHWPRRDRTVLDGTRIVGADPNYKLSFDQRLTENVDTNKPITSIAPPIETEKSNSPEEEIISLDELDINLIDTLESIKLILPQSIPHLNVRGAQLAASATALREKRCFWLVSDWGMDEDGFIWALRKTQNEEYANFYGIEVGHHTTIQSFQNEVKRRTGKSFEKLCNSLSNFGSAYLLFNEIPDEAVASPKSVSVIIKIVEIALEYCPDLKIILKSRKNPITNQFQVIELKPLDLPDTKSYIKHHPNGENSLNDIDAVTKIFRHTDGLPTSIETTLKNLEVISLSDLSTMSSDVAGNTGSIDGESEPLRKIILELKNSEDPLLQRGHMLLNALAMFPQGEQLARIKHYYQDAPLFLSHAQEIIDRRLAYTTESEGLANQSISTKTISVSRVVREVVVNLLPQEKFIELNKKAADIYFGTNWPQGTFKPPLALRFDKPGRSSAEIANARVIIQRIAIEAVSTGNTKRTDNAIALALHHAKALSNGSYYRATVEFLEDILSALNSIDDEEKLAFLKLRYAQDLRMVDSTGAIGKAKQILTDLPMYLYDKHTKQSALLSLALCQKALKENEEAILTAQQVVKIDPKNKVALNGKWIILELSETTEKLKKLNELEAIARKKKANVVANNIALSRINSQQDQRSKKEVLDTVINSSNADGDYYTAVRGILSFAEASEEGLSDRDTSRLIKAYHYLYNEGLSSMFDRCHTQLWRAFSQRGELDNLLQLFKYSSLVWRLRDEENHENSAISELDLILEPAHINELRITDQSTAYFMARKNAVQNHINPLQAEA